MSYITELVENRDDKNNKLYDDFYKKTGQDPIFPINREKLTNQQMRQGRIIVDLINHNDEEYERKKKEWLDFCIALVKLQESIETVNEECETNEKYITITVDVRCPLITPAAGLQALNIDDTLEDFEKLKNIAGTRIDEEKTRRVKLGNKNYWLFYVDGSHSTRRECKISQQFDQKCVEYSTAFLIKNKKNYRQLVDYLNN